MAKIREHWKQAGSAKKIALSLPILLVLLAIGGFGYVAVANYSGEQKWKAEKARLKAAGVTFNFKELLPPAVPDDDNFCAIPALYGLRLEENSAKRDRLGLLIDWNSGSEYNTKHGGLHNLERSRLGDTLAFLEGAKPGSYDSLALEEAGVRLLEKIHEADVDGVFAELASAKGRSESQFVPGWEKIAEEKNRLGTQVPHLSSVQGLGITNGRRAVAAGYAGKDDEFVEIIEIQLQIVRALLKEPTIMGELVAITNLFHVTNPIWERLIIAGMDETALFRLESKLAKIDLQRDLILDFHSELNNIRDMLIPLLNEPEDSGIFKEHSLDLILAILMKSKVKGDVQRALSELFYDRLIVPAEAGWPELAVATPKFEKELQKAKKKGGFVNLIAYSIDLFGRISNNTIYSESILRRTRIAIALERYYGDEGSYPESLSSLAPKYLAEIPKDPVTGGDSGYRKDETNGRYILWHTGFDAEDDGGEIIPKPVEGEELPEFNRREYEGDWVWKYPAAN